jgi:hypothetical protein
LWCFGVLVVTPGRVAGLGCFGVLVVTPGWVAGLGCFGVLVVTPGWVAGFFCKKSVDLDDKRILESRTGVVGGAAASLVVVWWLALDGVPRFLCTEHPSGRREQAPWARLEQFSPALRVVNDPRLF